MWAPINTVALREVHMIMLARKWNGSFPSMVKSRSDVWFQASPSTSLTVWILSCSLLTWGCRSFRGFLGEGELVADKSFYQWRCWTNREFLRNCHAANRELFKKERELSDQLTNELGLSMTEVVKEIELNKDPAGITVDELEKLFV